MIKRKGQPDREGVAPPALKRMSDTEYAAYFERSEHQERLPGTLFDRRQAARSRNECAESRPARSARAEHPHGIAGFRWRSESVEVCTSLMQLNRNEVLLCKRVCEHAWNMPSLIIARRVGLCQGARTSRCLTHGDNPRQVRVISADERETLVLMTTTSPPLSACSSRSVSKTGFAASGQRDHPPVQEVARVGFSESLTDATTQAQKQAAGWVWRSVTLPVADAILGDGSMNNPRVKYPADFGRKIRPPDQTDGPDG